MLNTTEVDSDTIKDGARRLINAFKILCFSAAVQLYARFGSDLLITDPKHNCSITSCLFYHQVWHKM